MIGEKQFKDKFCLSNFDETPQFQRRAGILTGYRVAFSRALALASVFRIHNETGNVWTHLLGFIWFCLHLYRFPTHVLQGLSLQDNGMILLFYASALACMFTSSTYHLCGSQKGEGGVNLRR